MANEKINLRQGSIAQLSCYRRVGSNTDGGGGDVRQDAVGTRLAEDPAAGHFLHCGLIAPPTASQAFVPGVARQTLDML